MLTGWSPDRERRAKELLYRCMEELGSTKAALYLAGSEGSFEIAVHYGFGRRDPLLAEIKADHPLWDWIRRKRSNPAFINHPREAPDLQIFLETAGTARILTIPLVAGDRLVGLVDARDKGRRQPFVPEDIPIAQSIGEAFQDFLSEIEMYGSHPASTNDDSTPDVPPPRRASSPQSADHRSLHRFEVEGIGNLITALSRLPGFAAIALTLTDGKTVRTRVNRAASLDHTQREALARHQIRCLESAGARVPEPASWGWSEQESGNESTADEIRTSLLVAGPPFWVVLSCLTPGGSAAGDAVFDIASQHMEALRQLRDYRCAARNLARTLLEPGETSYTHLRQHSQAVSELAQRMAALLEMSELEEEAVTLAGYLHDVGMRELEYPRIYRMERPGEVERRVYRRHPTVGARIVEHAEYPADLAGAILHHHERWDGQGYPQRLAGKTIPVAARIIHLAEVFDVLTSPSSYRRPVGRHEALETIRAEAGKQFDPDLVPVLEQAVGG